jgi:hypothetical protein
LLVSQKDRDLLLEIVHVLDVVTGHCPVEMRCAFHPLIDSVEFITRALDREEEWFSRLRIVDRHWLILGEFFESVCGVSRAEFFVAEARRVVKDRGLLESCEWLHKEIAIRTGCSQVGRPNSY